MIRPLVFLLSLGLFSLASVQLAQADDLADAKAFITTQVAAIKKGDVAAVKLGLTKRLHDRVTDEVVKDAQKQAGTVEIDELVASVAADKASGTLKIKMKNGRTLTTLVKVKGKWAADTLWFK